ERLEEHTRTAVARERRSEIRGYFRGAATIVCTLPPAVSLRALDLSEARSLHRPRGDQRFSLRTVDLGPRTLLPARREALEPRVLVERALLAVDPAPCERDIEGLRVRQPFLRALLCDAQQDA